MAKKVIEKRSRSNFERRILLGIVILPMIGFIYAIYLWPLSWLNMFILVFGWLFTGFGITIGYHRLLTHNSFQTYHWVKAGFQIAGHMAIQGPYLTGRDHLGIDRGPSWGPNHQIHHIHSDTEDDLHSPLQGFWHAHIGWLFQSSVKNEEDFVPRHLLGDPKLLLLMTKIDHLMPLWIGLSLSVPSMFGFLVTGSFYGAWTAFIWNMVRIFLSHHITWSINSICHTYGYRSFETADRSTNNIFFGILGLGEGWHNNHHKYQRSARHGLNWYEFDLSWLWIRYIMKPLGLAWNIYTPTLVDTTGKLVKNTASIEVP